MWKWLKGLTKRPPRTALQWVESAERTPDWKMLSQVWPPDIIDEMRHQLMKLVESYLTSDLLGRRKLHIEWADEKALLYPLATRAEEARKYRDISGELHRFTKDLAALEPTLHKLSASQGPDASNEKLVAHFTMLYMQKALYASVLSAIREYCEDDVTPKAIDDWQEPLDANMAAIWENHYRRLLRLPTTIPDQTGAVFATMEALTDMIATGHPNPYPVWRKGCLEFAATAPAKDA